MKNRADYPRLVVCRLTGVIATVRDADEERRFHRPPVLVVAGCLALALIGGLTMWGM